MMSIQAALTELKRLRDSSAVPYISVTQAAEIIGCKPQSLRVSAANGSLGSLEFVQVGNEVRVSLMSLIHSVCGGYLLDDLIREAKQ